MLFKIEFYKEALQKGKFAVNSAEISKDFKKLTTWYVAV